MTIGLPRGANGQLERHLLFFSGMLAVASAAYIPYTPGPIVPDIPAVAIPLAVSLGLVLFTFRMHPDRYESGQVEQIVGYGWIGLLVSAGIGGWWLAVHLYTGVPVGGVVDEILTGVSVGVGSGVAVGNLLNQNRGGPLPPEPAMHARQDGQPPDRDRLLEETAWTGRQSESPMFEAVVETLAELEGVEPTEVGPIYEYVNPEVFDELRRQERSQWQLHFYTETYEIRVSSLGTVSIYDAEPSGEPSRNVPV